MKYGVACIIVKLACKRERILMYGVAVMILYWVPLFYSRAHALSLYIYIMKHGVAFVIVTCTRARERECDVWGGSNNIVLGGTCSLSREHSLFIFVMKYGVACFIVTCARKRESVDVLGGCNMQAA